MTRIVGASAATQAAPAPRQNSASGCPNDDLTQVAVLWIDPPPRGTRSVSATLGAMTAKDMALYLAMDSAPDGRLFAGGLA